MEIPIRNTPGLTPLSPMQQRLWFLNQLETEASTLTEATAFRLDGVLDLDSLRGALTAIVARHEVLRTTYTVSDSGQPVQQIVDVAAIDLPVVDLSEVIQELQESEVRGIATDLRGRSFDLGHDLPFRLVLIRLGGLSHILIVVTHRIAADDWSGKLFFNEFVSLYKRLNQGNTTSLTELALQYADYAMWQREQLQQESFSTHIAYWREQFKNISTVELPTDHPRSGSKRNQLGRKLATIPNTLTDQLKTLSDHQGVPLFMTLLASFQVLIYRYTGQADIMVGSTIAGRPRPELQGLIGNFGLVVGVRNDLSGNPSFKELLVKVKESALKAYEHADLPVEAFLDEIIPKYNIDYSPICQILFAFEKCTPRALEIPGLAVTPVEIDPIKAPFDIFTAFIEQGPQLKLRLDYNADLFTPDTIDRMAGHFHTLLESIVSKPELRINELNLLTEIERQQQLVHWNDTRRSGLHGKSVVEIFEKHVELTPDAVAVVFESTQLTYSELNQRANQLAHYLIKHGVQVETPIVVFLDRSIELVVGLIAVLKAGGIYVPLDANYPRERLTLMLEEIRAPLVLSVKSLETYLTVHSAQAILLDSDQREIEWEKRSNPRLTLPGDSPAYVLFTSGSTGKPKGVVMGHGALANLISWQVENFGKPVRARTLQFAPLGFDVSIQEMFATLGSGGSLILIQDQLRRDGIGLLNYMQEHSVERVFLPFVALQQLADAAASCNSIPHRLREIITAGEQLHLTESLRSFLTRLGKCTLRNQYGPTESHVVTEFTLEPPFERWSDHPPIGQPIANTQIFILDPAMNPVPIGVAGEIFIGGDGLARGYLNQPRLTAEKFIANPFSADTNSRLYKTGDLSRYLPDGNIEFLGRIDHQVKIRGYRIELGEIETVLAQHSEVQAAVVVAREDSPGDKRLVGYVVLNHSQSLSAAELRNYLKEKLPEYMVPSAYVFLETFPLTPSGKVDRKALPIPDQSQAVLHASYLAPRTATEETLVNIWAEVLNVVKVGVRDNFFDLGGHSLSAVRLTTRVHKQFNMPTRVADVYQAPTIEQFAIFLQAASRPTLSSLVTLNREGSKCPFFWIHGEASDAYLPRYLGPDQPVYGLRHQSDDGQPAHYKSVEDIAAHYSQEIRSVRPQGPYLLGGYCFGALVALQIAQQLQTQGQKVDLLVFLNPAFKQTINGNESTPTSSLRDYVFTHLRNLSSLQLAEKWRYVLKRIKAKSSEMVLGTFTPVKKAAQEITWETYIRLGLSLPLSLRSPYILKIYNRAIQSYVPRPYEGRLIIFCDDDYPEPLQLAWSDPNRDQTTVYNVPGSHTSVLEEPNVGYWASKLKSCLDTLQNRPSALQKGKLHKTRPSWQIMTLILELATPLCELMEVFTVSQIFC